MLEIKQGDALTHLLTQLTNLAKKTDTVQRDIYIVAGVLGGVSLIILIAILVLFYLTMQLKKKMREAEIQKEVEEQMNAQKFAAYTGEELHRKLLAASTPAVPLNKTGGGPGSDYAFNAPFVDNRVLPAQNGRPAGSRLARY